MESTTVFIAGLSWDHAGRAGREILSERRFYMGYVILGITLIIVGSYLWQVIKELFCSLICTLIGSGFLVPFIIVCFLIGLIT